MTKLTIYLNNKTRIFTVSNKAGILFTVNLNNFLPIGVGMTTYYHLYVVRILVRCGLIKTLKKSN